MSDILRRFSAEGVDPLALAGVNDGNLLELSKRLGVRVSLRGDSLSLAGPAEAVERAAPVVQALVDLARMGGGETLDVHDVERVLADEAHGALGKPSPDEVKIILPGLRRVIQPKTAGQRTYLQAIAQNDIVIGIGPAGTGKTYLAVAMALSALTERRVERIVLARPAVEAGERLGFLPGDMAQKVEPYLRPLYDAIFDLQLKEEADRLLEKGIIEVAPLAFMRGRSLNDSFVILDEAQNTSSEQMKMFLTRIGFRSKAVITGDITQIDLPPGKVSGLVESQAVVGAVPGIAFVYFDEKDVVRHPLVQRIIVAYEAYQNGRDGREGVPVPQPQGAAPEGPGPSK